MARIAEAVSIFAEMIRYPDRDAESVARQLQAQGVDVEPCRIRRLLERHGLGSEKKSDLCNRALRGLREAEGKRSLI